MAWRGHLSRNLKELRLQFCQTSPASTAARDFVLRNYKDLKTLNPTFPILIRECRGTEPQLWVRYEMGVERCVKLTGLTEPDIVKALQELVKAEMGVERCVKLTGLTEPDIVKALQELVKAG